MSLLGSKRPGIPGARGSCQGPRHIVALFGIRSGPGRLEDLHHQADDCPVAQNRLTAENPHGRGICTPAWRALFSAHLGSGRLPRMNCCLCIMGYRTKWHFGKTTKPIECNENDPQQFDRGVAGCKAGGDCTRCQKWHFSSLPNSPRSFSTSRPHRKHSIDHGYGIDKGHP